ncbi:hypothetical protein NDU88_007028 [Pleurodeles waltl]|uniref:Uncharacterized protein n=1 Tax=Pleurodeles waltl TaxID=8319 RepID=A0AAV7WF89_PLEWA|nr:hypothetical protein NDU88_007028 [Pleurodeles waltl]
MYFADAGPRRLPFPGRDGDTSGCSVQHLIQVLRQGALKRHRASCISRDACQDGRDAPLRRSPDNSAELGANLCEHKVPVLHSSGYGLPPGAQGRFGRRHVSSLTVNALTGWSFHVQDARSLPRSPVLPGERSPEAEAALSAEGSVTGYLNMAS